MASTFDVIAVGSYSVDMIFSGMNEFPQLGKEVASTDFIMTPGEAFITAVTMHRLDIKVGWATDFGNDDFSLFTLKCIRKEGLDESLFIMHDRPFRRTSVSISYPDEHAFLTYYDPDPQFPAAISAIRKSQALVLYIPGLYYGSLLDVGIKLIRLKKMKMVMDGNSSYGDIFRNCKESAAIQRAIKSSDIFLPNAQEAIRLTGEKDLELAIRRLGDLCPLVVIKDGSNGSLAYENNILHKVPGIPINPIDTTGAGDNFNAGFLRAWLDGQSVDTCLKWGNILGGLSTTELGGTTWKTTIHEVKDLLSRIYP
jgi:sugar/nucleoside kinase (ribokinase family)